MTAQNAPEPAAPQAPVTAAPQAPALSARAALPWRLLVPLAALPALIAVVQLGRIHPDEVYQALEPAWWRVHGYGILAWEWREGIRNWSVPLVLSFFLRLCAALGIDHPRAYRAVLELPQLALHLASLVAVYRYALRRGGERVARWSTLAVGLYGPVLTFAGRTMSESISTALLLLAVEVLDREGEEAPGAAVKGGLWLGLAVVARYGSAVAVVAALLWLLLARRWRSAGWAMAGGAVALAGLALLDRLTWERPLHSFIGYLDFNVLSGRAAAQFGASPPSYYLPVLLTWAPLWAWVGGARALRRDGARSALPALPLFCAALYAVATWLTPHKEERFLYPALVLFALGAAPPLFQWLGEVRRADLRTALGSLCLCASAASFFWMPELRGDQFRAIVAATRPPEVTGLLIVNEGVWGAGGWFYVGKNIPWSVCDFATDGNFVAAMQDARFNRAVTFEGRELDALKAHGFRVLETVGRETILAR